VVAADPAVPFGTRVWVPGYGHGVVLDRGGAIRGLRLDVYIPDLERAREWGVRRLPVRLYGVGPEILRALEEVGSP
jgi:3D (Asp-Asp-Asp) domain-containing protein